MTDISADRSVTSPAASRLATRDAAAAAKLIRARYRSETRFKFYGLASILIAFLFVLGLLASILIKGLPAFWSSSLTMPVAVKSEDVDPSGKRDPVELAAADYQKVAYQALERMFPEVTDDEKISKLDDLLSTGAGDALRQAIVADPKLIGTTIPTKLLFSSNVDLYLKGQESALIERRAITQPVTVSIAALAVPEAAPAAPAATPAPASTDAAVAPVEGAEGEAAAAEVVDETPVEAPVPVVTVAGSAGMFATEYNVVREALLAQAATVGREAERLSAFAEQAEKIKTLQAEVESLKARAAETLLQLDDTMPSVLVRTNGGLVKLAKLGPDSAEGVALLPVTAGAAAGATEVQTALTPEANRKLNDQQIAWIERLREQGMTETALGTSFFTSGDSREPELAGIKGGLVGSLLTLALTLALCLPIGVMAAIYLEEFAPKNWITALIEVNINNLAAVPSIVFGLLGLAVFLNFAGMPRSAPLVGGLVLALLVLPTIIIAARAALKAVPPSIKEAALGVGASKQQAVFHHVLPLAVPGIMTGTIIGMAHALGETAPLLTIGMVAFILDTPTGLTSPATVLPVQIFLWSDLPEIGFQSKTAAAIMVLLMFLFVMNGLAILLRRRFERRW